MKKIIIILALAISLSGCVGTGRHSTPVETSTVMLASNCVITGTAQGLEIACVGPKPAPASGIMAKVKSALKTATGALPWVFLAILL